MSLFRFIEKNIQTKKLSKIAGFFLLGIFLVYILFLFSPLYVKEDRIVSIPSGFSLVSGSEALYKSRVIRSPFLFQAFGRIQGLSIKAGPYLFEEGFHNMFEVLRRVHKGDYGDVFVTVTLNEGLTAKQMADILDSKEALLFFDKEKFLELTKDDEGYLFPDTYSFLPDVSTEEIVATLKDTFQKKVVSVYQKDIDKSGKSLGEIVIMASLIEKEASSDTEEQKIISGILWKRIARKMYLQVDAPFLYIKGKASADLRISDLREDGPYNTYTRFGLPPGPIANPGVSSIEAALFPKESPYFFYLHDKNAKVYYAVDHDGHVKNKQRYLK